MTSTLVLNSDRNVRPELGTWIDTYLDLLLSFSLRIAEDVLAELQLQVKASSLNIQPTLTVEKGSDIALAAEILDSDVSGLVHFSFVRAALLNDLPIAWRFSKPTAPNMRIVIPTG